MFFNLDFVAECIKKLSDNTQCVTCDKLSIPCVRFPCGHSVCESCAERAGECLYCISVNTSTVVDNPQSIRVKNTLHLLAAFQETFKIDVEKRHRVSDYLKLEKQIFPECIQAPNKYINKRKSLNVSITNKENNSPIYFGDKTVCADVAKMKKNQYVQNWLNQHEDVPQDIPRKPFGDININTPLQVERKKVVKLCKINTYLNPKKSTNKKASYTKSRNNSLLLNKIKPITKIKDFNKINKNKTELKKYEESSGKNKCDRNESGIELDDSLTVVEDTISDTTIDKDKEAWLAVLEAARKDECEEKQVVPEIALQRNENKSFPIDSSNKLVLNNIQNSNKNVENTSKNVLFYKKGLLSETCKLCNIKNQIIPDSNMNENNDVSIVINNSEFVTSIKFMHCVQKKYEKLNKNCVEIQTDNSETKNCTMENTTQHKRKQLINDEVIPHKIIKTNVAIQSLDVFDSDKVYECTKLEQIDYNDNKNMLNDSLKHSTLLIVEDSDTDSNTSHGNIHEVIAEVHATNATETVQPDVLTTLSKSQYQKRSKRTLRGQTRHSSDSSDKENLDPNRIRHAKLGKKLKSKK